MEEIRTPDYVHYSRLKDIFAYEAQELLAYFQLRDKDITDPGEFSKLLNKEKLNAHRVLHSAFDDALKFMAVSKESPYELSPTGEECYNFYMIKVNVAEFCTWASKNKYKLPEELASLSSWPGGEIVDKGHGKEGDSGTKNDPKGKKTVAPATDNMKTVEGLLKMVFAMAKDGYGYDPADKKSPVTSEIMNALSKCGLSVSENTIRDRLKQAQMLLPRD